jgi:branched-subunit amino acid aminotransferase/4-amino-4-deoxychorismate lyase
MLELSADMRVDLSRSGARQGLGLFETIRVQAGQLRWLDLHLERLASGCAFLGLDAPPEPEVVAAHVAEHTAAGTLPWGVLRLIAVDGCLRVFVEPVAPPVAGAVAVGRSLETTRFSGNPLNRFKTLSYLENLRLAAEAKARNCFDMLAANELGRVCDGGRTTLFAVFGGQVFTPPVLDGALPGIARRVLLESGLVAEATLTWADLERAEALFLANALRGCVPVERLEGRAIPDPSHPLVSKAAAILT